MTARANAEQRRRAANLRAAADATADGAEAARMRAVADVVEGRTVRDVAKAARVREADLWSWLQRLQGGAPAGLGTRLGATPPRPRVKRLTDEQRERIARVLDEAPDIGGRANWTVEDLRDWLARERGLDLPVGRLGDEIRAMGYRKTVSGLDRRTRWTRTD